MILRNAHWGPHQPTVLRADFKQFKVAQMPYDTLYQLLAMHGAGHQGLCLGALTQVYCTALTGYVQSTPPAVPIRSLDQ